MKGMTPSQLTEVIQFINKYHRFGCWLPKEERLHKPNGEEFALNIKYIDSVYDTRDGSIWCIKFRGFQHLRFATNHFTGINPPPDHFKYENLFDWVMDFLKGEWTNNQILQQCYINEK